MYKDFRHYCHTQNPEPGGAWFWGGAGGTRIVALFTQEGAPTHHHQGHPGHAKLEYVNHALRELRKIIEREKFTSLALPKLATGVGGLKWEQVHPLITRHLGDLSLPIYLYTEYHAGMVAVEPSPSAPTQ